MAYWRLFWVGDGGDPVAGRPAPGWEDLEARERALGLRERRQILVSPDGRVDPRLSECLRRSAFSAKAQGSRRSPSGVDEGAEDHAAGTGTATHPAPHLVVHQRALVVGGGVLDRLRVGSGIHDLRNLPW